MPNYAVTDHEYSINGAAWVRLTGSSPVVQIGNQVVAIGGVRVRVAADVATGRAAGQILASAVAFTLTGGGNNPLPLAVPGNPQAVATSDTAIALSASYTPNATGYQFYFSATAGGTFAALGNVKTTPNHTHTGLTGNTSYYYKVQAIGDTTNFTDSPLTAVFSATTSAPGSGVVQRKVLCFGNSQTRGGLNPWPHQMETLLPAGYTVVNLGSNGAKFSDLLAMVTTVLAPQIDFVNFSENLVPLQEFANTLGVYGPVDAIEEGRKVIDAIHALDPRIKVLILSPYYRADPNGGSMKDYNDSISAITTSMLAGGYNGTMHADAMLDVSASQYLNTPAAAQNPAILYDGLHATDAFDQVIAHGVKDMILAGTGITTANWTIAALPPPTIGGTPHGTAQAVPHLSPLFRDIIGAFTDAGSFSYAFGTNLGFTISYTEGIELRWGNGYDGGTLECFKDGASVPTTTVVTAAGTVYFADYPTDGLSHSVRVYKSTAQTDGSPVIIWPATRYV